MLLLRREVLPWLGQLAAPRILHLAPEAGVEQVLRNIAGVEYESGDLVPGRAMSVVDLTQLGARSSSLDFLFVSHVLEHIPDDALAFNVAWLCRKPKTSSRVA